MPITLEDVLALEELDSKLRLLLPEQYQNVYEDVMPVSMGSATLKYDANGNVAWNDMWATFCDLAMAGGPPHRGSLLVPEPIKAGNVAAEICRGIRSVTNLAAQPSPEPGWIQVECHSEGMAAWLVRAIVMENVSARHVGRMLYLPAGPAFRLEKEIKNVILVVAKTCHYWTSHIPPERQQAIEKALIDSKLLTPSLTTDEYGPHQGFASFIGDSIHSRIGLLCFAHRYVGWIGVQCPNVRAALWLMRGLVAGDILARREALVLFLPANPGDDPDGSRVVDAFLRLHHLASVKNIL